jgi:hypothetical protein
MHSCFDEGAAALGIFGRLFQIHHCTPHVTTTFEVHRQFGRDLARASPRLLMGGSRRFGGKPVASAMKCLDNNGRRGSSKSA